MESGLQLSAQKKVRWSKTSCCVGVLPYTNKMLSNLYCKVKLSLTSAFIASLKVLMCLLPFILINSLNSSEINCGSLSDTSLSGRPYLPNSVIVFPVVVLDVVRLSIIFQIQCSLEIFNCS